MTRAKKTRLLLDEMQRGVRRLPFPFASFKEAQNCQDHIDQTGYAATVNKAVMEWYGERGYITVDYGIGWRVFSSINAYRAQ